MKEEARARRGRPTKPTRHPLGARLRTRREALGLTVRELAMRVGLRPSSASYISQMEAGRKAPNLELSRRLADALGDDPKVYEAWALLGKRSDPARTGEAIGVLSRLFLGASYAPHVAGRARDVGSIGEPGSARAGLAGDEDASPSGRTSSDAPKALAPPPPLRATSLDRAGSARSGVPEPGGPVTIHPHAAGGGPAALFVRIPEFEEGAPPPDPLRAPAVVATHSVDSRSLEGLGEIARPFACRISADTARRLGGAFASGDLLVLSRAVLPFDPDRPHAVRSGERVELHRVLWNGETLVVLGTDPADFRVERVTQAEHLGRFLAARVLGRLGS